MEFHLINHPVDCAICDQSGECKLQDYYMEYDHQPSRIRTYKLTKPKREILGPQVVYDAERCIMCTRCVRFMDEIAQEPQLAVVQRGSHSLISIFPGQPLDSQYSGNTVDICPVGALLNRDFRFQSRVWFVNKSPSVCTGCSNGCNVYVESRGNVIYRLLPRRNEEVNQVWMCDEGRLTYHANNEKRVEWARTGKGELAASVGPRIAVERAVELLMPLAGQGGVGVYISAHCTNEEAAAAFQLGAQLRATRYFIGGQPPGSSDDFLIRPDKNPNTNGVRLVAEAFGTKLEDLSSMDGVKALVAFRTDGLSADKLARFELLVAIAQNDDAAAAEAGRHLALPERLRAGRLAGELVRPPAAHLAVGSRPARRRGPGLVLGGAPSQRAGRHRPPQRRSSVPQPGGEVASSHGTFVRPIARGRHRDRTAAPVPVAGPRSSTAARRALHPRSTDDATGHEGGRRGVGGSR